MLPDGPWPLVVALPLAPGVNRAERSYVRMAGPRGARTPVLNARGLPQTVRAKSKEEAAWRREATERIVAAMREQRWWPPALDSAVEVALVVTVATPLQDLDGPLKGVLDALEDACLPFAPDDPAALLAVARGARAAPPRWRDRSVYRLTALKRVDRARPGIVLAARPFVP